MRSSTSVGLPRDSITYKNLFQIRTDERLTSPASIFEWKLTEESLQTRGPWRSKSPKFWWVLSQGVVDGWTIKCSLCNINHSPQEKWYTRVEGAPRNLPQLGDVIGIPSPGLAVAIVAYKEALLWWSCFTCMIWMKAYPNSTFLCVLLIQHWSMLEGCC